MTIMVSDLIQLFLSTQENIKVFLGLVEALMTYCSFFCKGQLNIEQAYYDTLPPGSTIFDAQYRIIQF